MLISWYKKQKLNCPIFKHFLINNSFFLNYLLLMIFKIKSHNPAVQILKLDLLAKILFDSCLSRNFQQYYMPHRLIFVFVIIIIIIFVVITGPDKGVIG